MSKNIALIVGSLRKESLNRKLAHALIKLAPQALRLEIVEIKELDLYNEDLENHIDPPSSWTDFRKHIATMDGIIFLTPEYNRSIPGALKNAIDVGSRPYGSSVWNNKPCAIISLSPGAIGGFGANQHLRQTFVCLNMPTLQQPEAYLGQAGSLFDEHDQLQNDGTKQFLEQFLGRFTDWIIIHSQK